MFFALGHLRKFIHINNERVKYSCDLIWATYNTLAKWELGNIEISTYSLSA